jgi:hypothetical protein
VNVGGNLCFVDMLRRKTAFHSCRSIPNWKMISSSTYGIGLEIGIIINHGIILLHISIFSN